jgi:hypothetical protein
MTWLLMGTPSLEVLSRIYCCQSTRFNLYVYWRSLMLSSTERSDDRPRPIPQHPQKLGSSSAKCAVLLLHQNPVPPSLQHHLMHNIYLVAIPSRQRNHDDSQQRMSPLQMQARAVPCLP